MPGAMLPWVDVLRRFGANEGAAVTVHLGVLDGDKRRASVHDAAEGVGVGDKVVPSLGISVEPYNSRVG